MTDSHLKERIERAEDLNDTLFREVLEALGVQPTQGIYDFWRAQAWTDAALALVERTLPGCQGGFQPSASGGFIGQIFYVKPRWVVFRESSRAATPALALLSALLTALQGAKP